MRSILITGCNRGLGLGLVKRLVRAEKPADHIFATCRRLEKAMELKSLATENPNICIIEMDVTDLSTYSKAVRIVTEKVGDAGLNVLINNAGISTKFTRLPLVKEEQLLNSFRTNVIAPIMLTQAFLPLLKLASKQAMTDEMSVNRAAVINITSLLGSIEKNEEGGFYPYRCSKSALNAATKSMSIDLKGDGILAITLHPGWVRTDMGGTKALLSIEESTDHIVNTMQSFTEEHTGCFVQYDGKMVPW